MPITWANGTLTYYTDQGALSPLLDKAGADQFVADAFSRWTSVNTAAFKTIAGGTLAEDVNGGNVVRSGNSVTMPGDILPAATDRPLAIIYDADGAVTDALLGAGAGAAQMCAANAVTGAADNFTPDGHYAHAVVVINGNCAQSSVDMAPLRYRLTRMLGRVIGIGWSQTNDNVLTGNPSPVAEDYAGLATMTAEPPTCLFAPQPCATAPEQLRLDDRAALSRLYPITSSNVDAFPGKQLFYESTIRIRGTVSFAAKRDGTPGQGMQGVNVVARLIDPSTGVVSRTVVATSVSGHLYRGDAGNPVFGFIAANGDAADKFGSNDPALEGYFDIAGLPLPTGASSADYQVTFEAVGSQHVNGAAVGPYQSAQVVPPGVLPAVIVSAAAGSIVQRDMVIDGSPRDAPDAYEPSSWAQPSAVPSGGLWSATLSGYGDADYYTFAAQAGRSYTFEVTATDDARQPTLRKAQLVVGQWTPSDAAGSAPAVRATASNAGPGFTQLAGTVTTSTMLKMGVADARGDGRPDFRYRARLFYADTVTPNHARSAGGTPLTVRGSGFTPSTTVSIGGVAAITRYIARDHLSVIAPAQTDGTRNVTVRDPATGAISDMTNAINMGVGSGDTVTFIAASVPSTPVGGDTQVATRFRVRGADGTTPIPEAAVALATSPTGWEIAACGGATTCTMHTDALGEISTHFTARSAGAITVNASISNGSHAATTLAGFSTTLDVSPLTPLSFVVNNATLAVPLRARALSSGSPAASRTMNFMVTVGSGTLSSASAITNSIGEAGVNLNVKNLTADVQVSVCVSTTCTRMIVRPIPAVNVRLVLVSGGDQVIPPGGTPAAIVFQVTDTNSPADPVALVPVHIVSAAFAVKEEAPVSRRGETASTIHHDAKALAGADLVLISDASGLVRYTPVIGSRWTAATVGISAQAGGAIQQTTLRVAPIVP